MDYLQKLLLALTTAILKSTNEQPITCKLQELSEPALQWHFPSIMTCHDVPADATTTTPGKKCTIDYSCPWGMPYTAQQTEMVCLKTGKWDGAMPDCTVNNHNFDEILYSFGTAEDIHAHRIAKAERQASAETKKNKEEEVDEEPTDAETTEEDSAPTPKPTTMTHQQRIKNLTNLCQKHKMCKVTSNYFGCSSIRLQSKPPKTMPRLQDMLIKLCKYCFLTSCNSSSTVLI